MAQNDFLIANAAGGVVRADINSALQSLATLSSGAAPPSTTYPFQFWADTTNNLLKMRNAANTAWVTIGDLDAENLALLAAVGDGLSKSGNTVSLNINGLTEDTTPDTVADFLAAYDASGAATKKVKPVNLFKQKPSFSAHKNGVDQASIPASTNTKVTFPEEVWDIGGHYDAANSRFQPTVPGKYRVSAVVHFLTGVSDGVAHFCGLIKNGSVHKEGAIVRAGGSGRVASNVTALVDMNGTTDYVEVFAYAEGAGTKTVHGAAPSTYFEGEMI